MFVIIIYPSFRVASSLIYYTYLVYMILARHPCNEDSTRLINSFLLPWVDNPSFFKTFFKSFGFIFFITNSTPIGVHPSQTFSVWPISDLVRLPAVVANPFRPAVATRAAVGVAAVNVMSSPLPLSCRARLRDGDPSASSASATGTSAC